MFDAQVTFADGSFRSLQVDAGDETGAIYAVLDRLLREHAESVPRGVSPGDVDRPQVVRVVVARIDNTTRLSEAPAGASSCEFCGKEYAVVPGMLRDCCAKGNRADFKTAHALLAPTESARACGMCGVFGDCPWMAAFKDDPPDLEVGPPWDNCRFWKPREGT